MQHRRARSRFIPVTTALVALAAATAAASADRAPTAPAIHLTDAGVAAMSPVAQATLLQPLRRLAGHLDEAGRSKFSGAYAGVALDATSDIVNLYVTSPAAGRRVLAAARKTDPHAAWSKVRLRTAVYSAAHLDSAARALITEPNRPAHLASIAVPVNGSGLDVNLGRPATSQSATGGRGSKAPAAVTARRATTLPARSKVDGVPVHFAVAPEHQQKSWAADKWHDSTPFIGGDMLTANGHGGCTAGLPTVNSAGRPVMITAAHCFPVGTKVYTGAGTPGAYGNGLVGNYVGTVVARNTSWDAEELVGADNNADESDTYGWKPLTSTAYSYDGDYVCQNGARSYYLGHPTPCGIKVTNQDLWFPIDGYWARGVEGVDVATGWGAYNGDSGGTVFAIEPGGVRQARGIVSSGGADNTPAQKIVDWTEAVDIFRAFALKLNPQT